MRSCTEPVAVISESMAARQGSVLDRGTIDEIRQSRKVQEVYMSRA